MTRLSRTRRVLKWACVAACVLMVTPWVVSMHRPFTLREQSRIVDWGASMSGGQLWVFWNTFPGFIDGWPRSVFGRYRWTPHVSVLGSAKCGTGAVSIPCWNLFIVLAAGTFWAWMRSPGRHKSGHCQKCGYDLTGNVSGRCPECGERI